jgi:hypothetical protein
VGALPPLPAMAVKEVNAPTHMGLVPAFMFTETVAGAFEFTVRTIAALVLILGEAQTEGEVTMQIMLEPLPMLLLLKVAVLLPTT